MPEGLSAEFETSGRSVLSVEMFAICQTIQMTVENHINRIVINTNFLVLISKTPPNYRAPGAHDEIRKARLKPVIVLSIPGIAEGATINEKVKVAAGLARVQGRHVHLTPATSDAWSAICRLVQTEWNENYIRF